MVFPPPYYSFRHGHALRDDALRLLPTLPPPFCFVQAADVATGVSTVATSLSSAAVSLAKPFLRHASKQVSWYSGERACEDVIFRRFAVASDTFSYCIAVW